MKLKQFVIGEASGTVSCLRYSSECSGLHRFVVTRRCTHFGWMGWVRQRVGCASPSAVESKSADESSELHIRQGKSVLNGPTRGLVLCEWGV